MFFSHNGTTTTKKITRGQTSGRDTTSNTIQHYSAHSCYILVVVVVHFCATNHGRRNVDAHGLLTHRNKTRTSFALHRAPRVYRRTRMMSSEYRPRMLGDTSRSCRTHDVKCKYRRFHRGLPALHDDRNDNTL